MLTLSEAKNGPATLADVARMNEYLNMMNDVQRAEFEKAKRKTDRR